MARLYSYVAIFALFLSISRSENASLKSTNGWIQTPNGMAPTHCVKQVPSGSVVVLQEKHLLITYPSGAFEMFPKCDYKIPERRTITGAVVYTYAESTNFTVFNGSWVVPADVRTRESDYGDRFFISLDGDGGSPSNDVSMIPSLQWIPSTEEEGTWSVTSWLIVGFTSVYSDPIFGNSGDTVYANMEMTNFVGEFGDWYVGVSFSNSDSVTSMTLQFLPEMTQCMAILFGIDINYCNEYPPDHEIRFSNLELTSGGNTFIPNWKYEIPYPECNQSVSILSPEEIIITY